MQVETSALQFARDGTDRFAIFFDQIEDYDSQIALWVEHLLTDMVTNMVILNYLNSVILFTIEYQV